MQYINMGTSGLKVSKLCLGTMNMGTPKWKPWIFDEKASEVIVKHAVDKGVNFIDLADFYSAGVGEEVLANIVRRNFKRDELVLLTKCGYPIGGGANNQGHSRKHVMDSIDGSLSRMKMDYVDIFMLHYFDVNTPVEETMRALNDIVAAGKARYIGMSTMASWQFAKLLSACDTRGWHRPINMQLQFNAAYREEAREMIPFCQDQGIGVSVFSPLARGLLTLDAKSTRNTTDFFTNQQYGDQCSMDIARSVGKVAEARGVAPAQVAQAWVLQNPGINVMIVGADSAEQFDSAVAAMDMQLSAEELYEIDRNYTPCDPITDYTYETRIPRVARPAKAPFDKA